jgi:hypothetical protein
MAFVRRPPVVRSAFARAREKGEQQMPSESSKARVRRRSIDKPTICELGMTRNGTLPAVARSGKGRDGAYGLSELDWDAVSLAILGVRAI